MPYLGPGIDNGYRSRFIYTATAGQTSFSGGDSQGITLTYTDSEYLDVYQNGVLLVPGDDYAATTGTTVVLVQGASLNDKVEMIQYQAFGVADTVSRADVHLVVIYQQVELLLLLVILQSVVLLVLQVLLHLQMT